MAKPPEAKLYGSPFQDRNTAAEKPSTGWLRRLVSGPKPAESKLYPNAAFREKK